jgi:hypothetical protein
MIGGVDIVVRTKREPPEALERCTRAVMRHWHSAVVQDAITGTIYPYSAVPFAASPEFMIYRDRAALNSWEELGADPSNENTMVHLLSHKTGQVTVVVDDPMTDPMPSILETLEHSLRDQSVRMGRQLHLAEAA